MDPKTALEILRNTPWNWYHLDLRPGVETLTQQGTDVCAFNTPPLHAQPSDEYAKRRLRIDEIGADVHQVHFPFGWTGTDTMDFTTLDYYLQHLCEGHPQRWILPRFELSAPIGWCKAHPEELCLYWKAPRDPKEIVAAIDTDMWDTHGCVPDGNKCISRNSFSSKLWLEDACKMLREFVEHIEKGPWAKQIIGYMPMIGTWGENALWGGWCPHGNPRMGDFGISHKKHFYDWCIEKYGDLDGLRKAWKDPELTFETFRVTTPPERWAIDTEEPFENFWSQHPYGLPPIKPLRKVILADDQRQVDCNEFNSKVCFDAVETFGKIIKEMTGGKPTGCFYGYMTDNTEAYCGQLAIERALTTPWLDFYSAPKGYHYCLAGDPGSSQAVAQSFSRKKLWIEENDMRSHHRLEKFPDDTYAPRTASDTVTCFWRELYRALTFNFGFWWMDHGGMLDDWYTDESMIAMFRLQSDFYKKWAPVERKPVSDVLWVEDEHSLEHMGYMHGIHVGNCLRLEREMRLCGVVMDRFRMDDLLDESFDLSRYKFIMFAHAHLLPKEKWEAIRARIRPDAHILWTYAAGMLDPQYNPDNQKAVTGFRTQDCPTRLQHHDVYKHVYWHFTRPMPQDYPLLEILPEAGQEVLQTSPDNHIITARVPRDEGANILAVDITLRTPILRQLMQDAGVNFRAPIHCTVLADDKLIGFFPRYDAQFSHKFDGQWRNVITGETVTGSVQLSIREKKFAIFEKVDS